MICLLDIDGVILPFGREEAPNARCDGQDIWLPERMPGLVRQLDLLFEIVWASMWEESSNQLGRMLGLDEKPFVRMPRRVPEGNVTLKLESVRGFVQGPFIWIDDEIGDDARSWALDNSGILIQTDPSEGLTASHIESLTGITS